MVEKVWCSGASAACSGLFGHKFQKVIKTPAEQKAENEFLCHCLWLCRVVCLGVWLVTRTQLMDAVCPLSSWDKKGFACYSLHCIIWLFFCPCYKKGGGGKGGGLPATSSDSLDISYQESQCFALQWLVTSFYLSSNISFSLIVTNVLPAYFLHYSGIMSIASWWASWHLLTTVQWMMMPGE